MLYCSMLFYTIPYYTILISLYVFMGDDAAARAVCMTANARRLEKSPGPVCHTSTDTDTFLYYTLLYYTILYYNIVIVI